MIRAATRLTMSHLQHNHPALPWLQHHIHHQCQRRYLYCTQQRSTLSTHKQHPLHWTQAYPLNHNLLHAHCTRSITQQTGKENIPNTNDGKTNTSTSSSSSANETQSQSQSQPQSESTSSSSSSQTQSESKSSSTSSTSDTKQQQSEQTNTDNTNKGSESGNESPGVNSDAESLPLPRRRGNSGRLVRLLILSGIGGIAYWFYSTGRAVEWGSATLLDQLSRLGPSSLYQPESVLSSWGINAVSLAAMSPAFREALCETKHIDQLLAALDANTYIIDVQKNSLQILLTLAADPITLPVLAAHPHIAQKLLTTAMSRYSSKEVSAHSFQLLKPIIQTQQAARDEFFQNKGLQSVSRAVRATQPEVANTAQELLAALVQYIPDELPKLTSQFTIDDSRSIFIAIANLGALYTDQQLPSSAIACYRIALLMEPTNASIMTPLALEHLKIGEIDEGINLLRKAIRIDPRNGEAIVHLYKHLLQPLTQISSIDQLLDKDKKMKLKQDCIASIPALKSALISLTAPDTPPQITQSLISPCYHLLLRSFEYLHQLNDAIDIAHDWTLHCPSDAVAYFNYGRLLIKSHQYDEAKKALNIAIYRDPSKSQSYYLLALIYYKQKLFKEAATTLEEAYKRLEEQHREVYIIRHTNSTNTANITNNIPLSPSIAIDLGRLDRLSARLALNSEDYIGALDRLNRYLSYHPNDSTALLKKAEVLQRAGQTKEAYRVFTETLRYWTTLMKDTQYQNDTTYNLSTHTHATAVIQSIGQTCETHYKQLSNISHYADNSSSTTDAAAVDDSYNAFQDMCRAYEDLKEAKKEKTTSRKK